MLKKFCIYSGLVSVFFGSFYTVEAKPKKINKTKKEGKPVGKKIKDTKSKYILMDFNSGMTLEESEAEVRMAPSSMTKLMTLYVLFSHIKSGIISLKSEFLVSQNAKKIGGSKSFLEEGTSVDVETLIRCIIVHSGNDASMVVAEGISGSVEKFAVLMNKTAEKIGLTNSHFCNPTGWPDEEHYSTVKDIALLSKRLIEDFPEFYKYFSEREFEMNGIRQANRNKLLWKNFGVDGLKTGHTDAGGYGLAASAHDKNCRLISVVNGCSSTKQRETESENLLRRGFNMVSVYTIAKKYKPIRYVDVWLGKEQSVPLVSKDDIKITVLKENLQNLHVKLEYRTPISAPVIAGSHIGNLVVENAGNETRYPLFAGRSVEKLNEFNRAIAAVKFMLFGSQKVQRETDSHKKTFNREPKVVD